MTRTAILADAYLTGALALAVLMGACTDPSASPTALSEPAPLFSASATTEDVVMFATGAVAGTSTLVRNDNGVSMTFRTSGLQPGTVATIWWVVFNKPELCVVPGSCGADDVFNPAQVELVDISVFFAAGHVIGGSGRANYGAGLPAGKLTVDPDPAVDQLIIGDGILKDPRGAEIHLVLRTHGPAIPGLIQHQVSTFNAGCTTAPPALQGPNTCMNLQFAVHLP